MEELGAQSVFCLLFRYSQHQRVGDDEEEIYDVNTSTLPSTLRHFSLIKNYPTLDIRSQPLVVHHVINLITKLPSIA